MKMQNMMIAFALCAGTVTGGNVKDATFDAVPGESWQLDWSWREKKVPLTAMMRPHLTAYDVAGKVVYNANVGTAQQRVYDPADLNIQKWRVFATVRREGEERKRGTMVTLAHVFLPPSTAKIRMTLENLGDAAEIDNLEMGIVKRSSPPEQKWHPFPRMSEEGIKILTDAELDEHLAKRPVCVPKLVPSGDRTELLVNGKPVVPRVYKGTGSACANRLPAVSIYSRKGFNIFTMGFRLFRSDRPEAQSSSGIWREDGTCDLEKVRMQIREYLKRAPDAMFMLAFGVAPYVGWGEKHQSEIFRNEKGQFGIFRGCRICDYRDTVDYDYRKGEFPAFSYTSEEFAAEAAAFLEQLFAGIESMPEGKAVIGAYVCGGTDGQWLDPFDNNVGQLQAADYSDVAKRRFAEFRRVRYGKEVDSTIPSAEAFWDRKNQFYSEHAPTVFSDYREFFGRATTQFRLTLAKGVKRGSKGRVLVGSYSPAGGLEGFPLISMSYTKGLIQSPDYDFFAVVPNYLREHVDPVIAAIYDGSTIARGKLYISELDLRSADVCNWGFWGSPFWRENHNAATFRRKALYFAANAITHGGGFHAYDMDGGWFATDASQATWTAVNSMVEMAHPMPFAPERIAIVGGERLYDHQSFGKSRVVPYFVREQPRDSLSRAGVPWSHYLLEDVLDDKAADMPKVVIFNDLSTASHAQFQELKRRYANDGRVIVWSWRPGIFAPDGEKIDKELGIQPAPAAFGKLGFADGSSADPLMKGVTGSIVPSYPYYDIEYAPVCTTSADAGWKTLATFKGTDIPALAVRRNKTWTEVFTSMPGGITPALCRNLVREAGFRPLVDTDELSGYGSGIFYMVAQSNGRKRFRLPKGVSPDKVVEGPAFRKDGDGYSVALKRGDIFILSVK